jgi:hypothetical protein
MQTGYHRAITTQALGEFFSPAAIETIVAANLGQDRLTGQFGHDEYHFDQNAFQKSWSYVESNRRLIRPALQAGDRVSARRALGRLTHAVQDLYAHSNYVPLWLRRFPDGQWPAAEAIDPFDETLLAGPDLRSGKLYYPLEVLSFIPGLKKYVKPLLPHDSHAWMNLDSPESGSGFDYAMAAAVKRTRYEYDRTVSDFSPELLELFRN